MIFSERLENGLYRIIVLDTKGNAVTDAKTELSQDQREISLALPSLPDGLYTTSYKVISADGHPIRGSYIFIVGQTEGQFSDEQGNNISNNVHDHANGGTGNNFWFYMARFVYYVSLLVLIGLLFWLNVWKLDGTVLSNLRKTWIHSILIALLVSFVITMLYHIESIFQQEDNFEDLIQFFSGTTVGITWLFTLGLTLIGFACLQRNKWIDLAWIVLITTTEALNGHPMGFTPELQNVVLDFVHIITGAIWAGGLIYVYLQKRFIQDKWMLFLPVFSKVALISILTLVVTGTAITLAFIPDIDYLIYSLWGILLLIKITLVLVVVLVGILLRNQMRKKQQKHISTLLKIDTCLMLLILVIVGIFTMIKPLPSNNSLEWTELSINQNVNVSIAPNTPGVENQIKVKVWMPDSVKQDPKQVLMYLHFTDRSEDVAPIEVKFNLEENAVSELIYPGFMPHSYISNGSYLPFAGKWEVEVRVMDPDDNETVYRRSMRLFKQ